MCNSRHRYNDGIQIYGFKKLWINFKKLHVSNQGAKKIIFTACHSGKLKLAFTSPDVISTSPKNFLTSRIDFTVLLFIEFLKKHHLPIGQVKNRIHQPDSKIHQPRAIGHYFLCTLAMKNNYSLVCNIMPQQPKLISFKV